MLVPNNSVGANLEQCLIVTLQVFSQQGGSLKLRQVVRHLLHASSNVSAHMHVVL